MELHIIHRPFAPKQTMFCILWGSPQVHRPVHTEQGYVYTMCMYINIGTCPSSGEITFKECLYMVLHVHVPTEICIEGFSHSTAPATECVVNKPQHGQNLRYDYNILQPTANFKWSQHQTTDSQLLFQTPQWAFKFGQLLRRCVVLDVEHDQVMRSFNHRQWISIPQKKRAILDVIILTLVKKVKSISIIKLYVWCWTKHNQDIDHLPKTSNHVDIVFRVCIS